MRYFKVKWIVLQLFALFFLLMGCVIFPFCFVNQFYKLSGVWSFVIAVIIGVPPFLILNPIYRKLLEDRRMQEAGISKEYRIFEKCIIAAFCAFAFIVPCVLGIVDINISAVKGLIVAAAIHFMGIGIAAAIKVIGAIAEKE